MARAVRDLREIVNVSRLSYIDSDEDDSKYSLNSPFSFHSSVNFEQSSYFNDTKRVPKNIQKSAMPIFSSTTPMQSTNSLSSSSIFNQPETNSSFFKDSSLLLDRNSKPSINKINSPSQISLNTKKPLPPLKTIAQQKMSEFEIQPLTDYNMPSHSTDLKETGASGNDESIYRKNGNFDKMLTYIDASVVSDWLNRANRALRKMHHWHQDNSNLYDRPDKKHQDKIKYESFINFANFWLGCDKASKLDHRQRRKLLEMEYSIICDEVTQAFQIGIDSQRIGIADVHCLLHAVFKEYPLQLQSFRGVYMFLDYIDTLSSNRLDKYRVLLSDVKCRTVNKQYAQWLLSIRSFSLINLSWSIIKFYKKTAENGPGAKVQKKTPLDELNERLSSLSMNRSDELKKSSVSASSPVSSSSTSSELNNRPNSSKNNFIKRPDIDFIQVSETEKHNCYLKATFKNDYPEVLHYLVTTKKCDPYVVDEQGRTLLFLAVINDLPKILNYLVKRWPSIDINQPCHSGNTPLHAAVNQGNLVLVELLLKSLANDEMAADNTQLQMSMTQSSLNSSVSLFNTRPTFKLDVNKRNEKCMDMTPLHLAVFNNYDEIAIRLVQSDADPNLKMKGEESAFSMALENKNQVLYELLGDYYHNKNTNCF